MICYLQHVEGNPIPNENNFTDIQQVTDPVAQPTIPDGNDPDMDDYVDWEWDTVPEGYSTTGQSTMSNGVTDSSSQLGCALAVLWLCVLLSVNLI